MIEKCARLATPLFLFAPFFAHASAISNATQLVGILCTIMRWFFAIFIVVAVIFVILAAFKYLTGGGDPEKLRAANHSLVYTFIAIAVALIARTVPDIVANLIGASSVTGCPASG